MVGWDSLAISISCFPMRYFFTIILSLLFLTSSLFGDSHKGEVLYRWETPSGVKWMGFGKKDLQDYYKGQVENGKPQGLGVLRYVDGSKYVGEWNDGEENGQGTYTFPDGSMYVGEFKDGKQDGKGTYTDGIGKYDGEWKDGNLNGQGTLTFSQ